METVMILGAGPLQLPAIRKTKELGLKVVVCDYDPNAVGFSYADEPCLISTIDQEAVLEKAKIIKPDYVITSTSDAPVRTAAYVSEKLGLPSDLSYENAICATVKSAMRDRLKKHQIPIPQYFSCGNFSEFVNAVRVFDDVCIIKPSDSAASRGVMQIKSKSEDSQLREYYHQCVANSRNHVVMVEEFMTGPEVSVESFIENGKVTIIAITDKLVTPLPYFVELGHSEQSNLPLDIKERIELVTKQAIKAIGIVNGVSHTELKVTSDGVKIVEIAARLGGDYITSRLVPLSTGVDMVGNSILLALHKQIDIEKKFDRGSAIRFICAQEGMIKKIYIPEEAYRERGVEEIKLYSHEGAQVHALKSSNDRIGHIITTGKDSREAVFIAEKILKNIRITIR